MLARIAATCYRRRRIVVIVWVLLLVGVNVAANVAGGDLLKSFSLPKSESDRAFGLLREGFARGGDTGQLVYSAAAGRVDAPQVAAVVDPVVAKIRNLPHVVEVDTPSDPGGGRFVSPDGTVAYAEIIFDLRSNDVPPALAADILTDPEPTSGQTTANRSAVNIAWLEGAPFVAKHLIEVPTKAFDDFAGAGLESARNRRVLGLA